mmetsp:Transcript_11693/g.45557  ORF Transcript_11693/g.45557 Transcript_11693/m.45557 type:complete len:389 (-) Transcript_11693:33-1199(-)
MAGPHFRDLVGSCGGVRAATRLSGAAERRAADLHALAVSRGGLHRGRGWHPQRGQEQRDQRAAAAERGRGVERRQVRREGQRKRQPVGDPSRPERRPAVARRRSGGGAPGRHTAPAEHSHEPRPSRVPAGHAGSVAAPHRRHGRRPRADRHRLHQGQRRAAAAVQPGGVRARIAGHGHAAGPRRGGACIHGRGPVAAGGAAPAGARRGRLGAPAGRDGARGGCKRGAARHRRASRHAGQGRRARLARCGAARGAEPAVRQAGQDCARRPAPGGGDQLAGVTLAAPTREPCRAHQGERVVARRLCAVARRAGGVASVCDAAAPQHAVETSIFNAGSGFVPTHGGGAIPALAGPFRRSLRFRAAISRCAAPAGGAGGERGRAVARVRLQR